MVTKAKRKSTGEQGEFDGSNIRSAFDMFGATYGLDQALVEALFQLFTALPLGGEGRQVVTTLLGRTNVARTHEPTLFEKATTINALYDALLKFHPHFSVAARGVAEATDAANRTGGGNTTDSGSSELGPSSSGSEAKAHLFVDRNNSLALGAGLEDASVHKNDVGDDGNDGTTLPVEESEMTSNQVREGPWKRLKHFWVRRFKRGGGRNSPGDGDE